MEISIKPIITEAATKLSEKRNCYTFRVSPEANKYQIKSLIEQVYGVKVLSVNTANMRGKTAAWKKAYVTVAAGQTIEFFSNI